MEYKLRAWTLNDIPDLVHHANNLNIAKFMTDQFPNPYTEQHAMQFINMVSEHQPTRVFAITIDGHAVGSIGLHPQQDIMKRNAELGYWLGEEFWGKGIITNVVQDMIQYAFKTFDISRIYARPFGSNIGSQKVLEKAGFMLEAKIPASILKYGFVEDELIYAVRRETRTNTH